MRDANECGKAVQQVEDATDRDSLRAAIAEGWMSQGGAIVPVRDTYLNHLNRPFPSVVPVGLLLLLIWVIVTNVRSRFGC